MMDVTGRNTNHAPSMPRLVKNLQLCLASLYGIDGGVTSTTTITSTTLSPLQTHEFLMQLQTRNVRRQLQSIYQQHQDSLQNSITSKSVIYDAKSARVETVHMGSSWLACLALLCRTEDSTADVGLTSSKTERLFCAQTLLHRCRSVKLVEAIDFEFESFTDTNEKRSLLQIHEQVTNMMIPETLPLLIQSYMALIRSINPLVARVLQDSFHYTPDEERAKTELSILTLATVAFQIAWNDTATDPLLRSTGTITPLLSTTVSALATTAFRWCYTTNGPSQRSLLALLRHVFALVWVTLKDDAFFSDSRATVAMSAAFLSTVASVPDGVLGSPGGARGRLSADPRAIQAASRELRSAEQGGSALLDILSEQAAARDSSTNAASTDVWILQTCARWATFLPLSLPILQLVLPLLNCHLASENKHHRTIAYSLLVAIYDGASWSAEQILSSSLGLSSEQAHTQQQSKKKPTSRSKKRQKERISSSINNSSVIEAQAEQYVRGETACHATMYSWAVLNAAARQALEASCVLGSQVQGEGPIGCVALCANACLPHILRHPSSPYGELFRQITSTFQYVCASPNAIVRALALEPLFTLHRVLIDMVQTTGRIGDRDLEELVVHHFSHCLLNLSSVCPYPSEYFDHMCAESDQDLEIERNDIRDLLRTISGSGEGGSTVDSGSNDYPLEITIHILYNIVNSCRDAVIDARVRRELCSEVAVHTFSSLAKPMNQLAKCFARDGGSEQVRQCMFLSLQVLVEVNQMMVDAFLESIPDSRILPLSRTVNIASASYSPFLAAVASLSDADISEGLSKFLDVVIHASILSVERLPELPGPSILKHSIYDLRGTMRGPGGEDHVGCLTLMRCSLENDVLSRMSVSCVPYISRLCELHQGLKHIEIERGQHIFHGKGVTPQTRRILVGTLCRLEQASQGHLGASSMLSDIFSSGIFEIASFQHVPLAAQELFRITESALDLASFTPAIVTTLFECSNHELGKLACIDVLTYAVVRGWIGVSCHEALLQWNRHRAALFALLKKGVMMSGISERVANVVIACVHSECECIHQLCARGPASSSTIFTDDFVSPESIPAGLFIRVLYEMMRAQNVDTGLPPNCIQVLLAMKDAVLSTMKLPCPEPLHGAFVDPRPTLAEAWLHVMIVMMESKSAEVSVEVLVIETFTTIVTLLFYPTLGKVVESDCASDIGMSLDGPHCLALTSFLAVFFRCGLMPQAARLLIDACNVDSDSVGDYAGDRDFQGVAVIAAALFRACQGALPPWAIESIPDIFSSFYVALNNDTDTFGRVIQASMELRLSKSDSQGYGGVAPGKLLSGVYFEATSSTAKATFVQEVKQLAALGGSSNWRRLKGLVKAVCGGKKKDTNFKQKPSAYRWEFDRV